MYYPNSSYVYNSSTGGNWRLALKAAQMADASGRLPGYRGTFNFLEIQDPSRLGMSDRHPLQEMYPNIRVVYLGLIVEEDFFLPSASGGMKGLSFYIDNNGSSLSASVASQFGRSDVALNRWEREMAQAKPYWEWKTVPRSDGKGFFTWTNARGHGFAGANGEYSGRDWNDGVPVNEDLYDPYKGRTVQSIIVPRVWGIGTADQTVDWTTGTYSWMLYFPRSEAAKTAKKMSQLASLMTQDEARQMFSQQQSYSSRGATRSYGAQPKGLETLGASRGTRSAPVQEAYTVTHSTQEIKQPIVPPPNIPGLWSDQPEAVVVGTLITPETARALTQAEVPAGRQVFF